MQKLLHCRPNGAEDHGGVNEVYLPDGFGEVVGPQRKDLLQHLSSCVWTCVIVSDVYTECIHRVYTHTHMPHTHTCSDMFGMAPSSCPPSSCSLSHLCVDMDICMCVCVRACNIHTCIHRYTIAPRSNDYMERNHIIQKYVCMCTVAPRSYD